MDDPTPWIATQAATGQMQFLPCAPARVLIPNPAYENAGIEVEFKFVPGCFMKNENKTRPNPAWFTPPHLKRKVSKGQYDRALKNYHRAKWQTYSIYGRGQKNRVKHWVREAVKWSRIVEAFAYQKTKSETARSAVRYAASVPKAFFQNPFCIHGVSITDNCPGCAFS